MATPEVSETTQWAMTIVGGIIAAMVAFRGYFRGLTKSEPSAQNPQDFVVAGGSFIDMTPIREISESLKHLVNHTAALTLEQRRVADLLAEIRDLMRKEAQNDDIDQRISNAMVAAMAKGVR